jgi:hypothetical protein
MTRRNWVLVLVIVGAVVIAGVLVIGGLAVIGWRIAQQGKTTPDQTPVTEADKRLVVTAGDVARLGGPAVHPEAEDWSSLRQGNGSRFILYLYEPKSEPRISLYSRVVILPDPAGARQMYQMDKVTMKLGARGESYVPAPELLPEGGSDRSAWFIEKDGEKIGNFFLIREGRFLQSAKLTGLTLHKPADVQDLLAPMLSESSRRTSADGGSKR